MIHLGRCLIFLERECKAVTDVLLVLTSLCFNTSTSFLLLEKCASSDNPVLRTLLALCCRDAVGAVCDLYKLTTHDPCHIACVYCETAYMGLLSEDGSYLG